MTEPKLEGKQSGPFYVLFISIITVLVYRESDKDDHSVIKAYSINPQIFVGTADQ